MPKYVGSLTSSFVQTSKETGLPVNRKEIGLTWRRTKRRPAACRYFSPKNRCIELLHGVRASARWFDSPFPLIPHPSLLLPSQIPKFPIQFCPSFSSHHVEPPPRMHWIHIAIHPTIHPDPTLSPSLTARSLPQLLFLAERRWFLRVTPLDLTGGDGAAAGKPSLLFPSLSPLLPSPRSRSLGHWFTFLRKTVSVKVLCAMRQRPGHKSASARQAGVLSVGLSV